MVGTGAETMFLGTRSPDTPTPWLQTTNRVLVAVGLAVSTTSLLIRVYTKARLLKKFWWDDVFAILSWIFAVGTQFILLYGYVHGGIGVHTADLSIAKLNIFMKAVLVVAVIYIPCLAFAKIALLMLYYRLLFTFHPWKNIIYIVAAVIVSYSLALMLALIFACSPLEKGWNATITTGKCINRPGLYLATALTNTLSDIVLILIPIRIVRSLHLPLAQKIGIAILFGLGCLTIVTSIIRLATIWPLVQSNDQTYKLALAGLFVIIEANFIIICGSLPYLRQFAKQYVPKWFLSSKVREELSTTSFSAPTRKVRSPRIFQPQDDIERALDGLETDDNTSSHVLHTPDGGRDETPGSDSPEQEQEQKEGGKVAL